MRKIVIDECTGRQQKIHGINTCHAVFEVLLKPVAGKLKIVKIPEGDKEARKHEEDGYADVKFVKKALKSMRHGAVKNIGVMRNKNKIGSKCTYAC